LTSRSSASGSRDALTADGGEPGPCGWLKDRYGLSWQIVPEELNVLVSDPDPERARRAMEAMLQMGKIEVEALRRAADGPNS
jgi:predicted 3-demethylubiquinone-9 3-methyltransferase (glyoxalase superfamily)